MTSDNAGMSGKITLEKLGLGNNGNIMPYIPPMPPLSSFEPYRRENDASDFRKRLLKWIGDFEGGLDDAQEVGARLVNFGQTITFHLVNVGYWNPELISFEGVTDSGERIQLVQHVSQISVLLMAMPKLSESDQPRRIGFSPGG